MGLLTWIKFSAGLKIWIQLERLELIVDQFVEFWQNSTPHFIDDRIQKCREGECILLKKRLDVI